MKKIICTFMLSFIAFILTSCTYPLDKTTKSEIPGEKAQKTLTQIITCFENEDENGLKELFSDYMIKNDASIDDEIDAAFELIDGEIVSCNSFYPSAMGSYEKKSIGGSVYGVITDKGTEYTITFVGWMNYENDQTRVGVEGIRVVNATKSSEYPPDAVEKETCRVKIGHFE